MVEPGDPFEGSEFEGFHHFLGGATMNQLRFAPPPLQRFQHYYELLRPLAAHRYYRPRLLSLCLSLHFATEGSRSST